MVDKLMEHAAPAAARINEPIEPMELGNMRANGVRSPDVSCWQCTTGRS
jgi:hypothetical protein